LAQKFAVVEENLQHDIEEIDAFLKKLLQQTAPRIAHR